MYVVFIILFRLFLQSLQMAIRGIYITERSLTFWPEKIEKSNYKGAKRGNECASRCRSLAIVFRLMKNYHFQKRRLKIATNVTDVRQTLFNITRFPQTTARQHRTLIKSKIFIKTWGLVHPYIYIYIYINLVKSVFHFKKHRLSSKSYTQFHYDLTCTTQTRFMHGGTKRYNQ